MPRSYAHLIGLESCLFTSSLFTYCKAPHWKPRLRVWGFYFQHSAKIFNRPKHGSRKKMLHLQYTKGYLSFTNPKSALLGAANCIPAIEGHASGQSLSAALGTQEHLNWRTSTTMEYHGIPTLCIKKRCQPQKPLWNLWKQLQGNRFGHG